MQLNLSIKLIPGFLPTAILPAQSSIFKNLAPLRVAHFNNTSNEILLK
jgi:hypothetical protein